MTPRACPFCRITIGDRAIRVCDTCGVPLVRARSLGPSPEEIMLWESLPLGERVIPLSPISHGRALLTIAAILGCTAYFLPWLDVHAPDTWRIHGVDLGRRILWPHAVLAAWVVIVPTAVSRRSLGGLLAARAVLVTLALVPLVTLAVLGLRPPKHLLVHVEVTWLWGAALEAFASILGVFAAIRLGRRGRR